MRQLRPLNVPSAIGRIVRALAASAETHATKLERGRKAALHDLRVSVRRIRTLLRTYQNFLPHELRSRRTELSSAMRQTNVMRDLEVHDEMLAEIMHRRHWSAPTRRAVKILQDDMRHRLDTHHKTSSETAQAFKECIHSLLGTIDRFSSEPNTRMYCVTTADIVQRETTSLVALIQSLDRARQVKRLHKTRLAAKLLRYVIEPLPDQLVGVRDGINRLKRLQTLLGSIRDKQTLHIAIATAIDDNSHISAIAAGPILPVIDTDKDRLFASFLNARERGNYARLGRRLFGVSNQLRR